MVEIKDIIVWRKNGETRIYIHAVDGREACKYATGNPWHAKNTWESQLTDDELKRAKQLGVVDGKWKTVYEWDMAARIAVVDGTPKPVQTNASPTVPLVRTNREPAHCQICGRFLQAGEGELVHLTDEEDIDFLGRGSEWIVYCLNTTACQARVDEAKREAAQKEAAKAAGLDEATQLAASTAVETGLTEQMDWSRDDFRFSHGAILAESEHYTAREYLEAGQLVGFVIKRKGD